MGKRSKKDNIEEKFLTKTQEVHYQKEFKRANRIYEAFTRNRNQS